MIGNTVEKNYQRPMSNCSQTRMLETSADNNIPRRRGEQAIYDKKKNRNINCRQVTGTDVIRRRNGASVRYTWRKYRPEWHAVLGLEPVGRSRCVVRGKVALPLDNASVTPFIRSSQEAAFLWPHSHRISLIDISEFVLSETTNLTVPLWLASTKSSIIATVVCAYALRGLIEQHAGRDLTQFTEAALGFVVNGKPLEESKFIGTSFSHDIHGTQSMENNLIDLLTMSYSEYEAVFNERMNTDLPLHFSRGDDFVENISCLDTFSMSDRN